MKKARLTGQTPAFTRGGALFPSSFRSLAILFALEAGMGASFFLWRLRETGGEKPAANRRPKMLQLNA